TNISLRFFCKAISHLDGLIRLFGKISDILQSLSSRRRSLRCCSSRSHISWHSATSHRSHRLSCRHWPSTGSFNTESLPKRSDFLSKATPFGGYEDGGGLVI